MGFHFGGAGRIVRNGDAGSQALAQLTEVLASRRSAGLQGRKRRRRKFRGKFPGTHSRGWPGYRRCHTECDALGGGGSHDRRHPWELAAISLQGSCSYRSSPSFGIHAQHRLAPLRELIPLPTEIAKTGGRGREWIRRKSSYGWYGRPRRYSVHPR